MRNFKLFFTTVTLLVFLFSGYALTQEATKVNINTATVEELVTLPGVGDSVAKNIVEHREKNGGFKTTEELINVKGIGEKKFEKIKDLVTVGESKKG
ncbi:MAG: helix-hairpin-helix domain-containing protein [Deltaproteobacteria bacterium]|nr:helix-hairpin-helix domain-containing protein [Deltaproteobacteria bacterium]